MSNPENIYIPSTLKNHRLHTLLWIPEQPRAVIQISHGMTEHIGRYYEFARWMNERGIAVVGASHLGHGLTAAENNLGFIAKRSGWDHMVRDIDEVRKVAQERVPDVPYLLLGHSMGSFIARDYITRDFSNGLAGAVISGTAAQPLGIVRAGRFVDRVCTLFQGKHHRSKLLNKMSFGAYNDAFKPNRTEFDWLSRNDKNVDCYIADPLCGFCFTLSAFKDLFDGLEYIGKKKNIKKVKKSLPCLFIAGEKDPVGNNGEGVKKVADAFRSAGVERVELKLYPEDRHEVLNELDREDVFFDVLAFVESVL